MTARAKFTFDKAVLSLASAARSSALQELTDFQQFRATLLADGWVCEVHLSQALIDQERYQQAAVGFLIGRYDVPWRPRCAGMSEAVLVRFHVSFPEETVLHVRR